MTQVFKNPFGIRFKLVFLSSFLLVIPWLGYRYILEMEDYLRRGQEQVVLGTAQALATALNERPELFDEGAYSPQARRSENLYVYPIYYPLALDDSTLVDWRDYQRYELSYGRANTIATPLNPQSEFSRYYHNDDSLNFKLLVGEHNRFLYAYLKVVDDQPVYRAPESLSVHRSDFLQISLVTRDGELKRYVISPRGPEFIYAYEVGGDLRDIGALTHEERISGQWYETPEGYTIELRLPLAMLGDQLGFAIYDVDDPETRRVTSVVATSDVNDPQRLGRLMCPTPEIDKIVEGMGHTNSRIQVVDRSNRVLLSVGDIQSASGLSLLSEPHQEKTNKYWRFVEDQVLHPLYYQLLTKPSNDFFDELYVGSTLEGEHLSAALAQGEPRTQFRAIDDSQLRLLEAAYPIFADGEVMGAVMVDQNMNGLRTFRNQALETLFNTILGVMLMVAFGLFFFASRISSRIRGLRNQAENIIDDSGRLKNTIVASRNSDEIGDLSRSFYNIVERLGQYTNYLENMSSRLSHELRTPVTVVRSSLENLGMTVQDTESSIYIQRAEEGISRLNLILTNMSEATRLEQMLQTSEKETMDLAKVIAGCVEGYRLAYPEARIEDDLEGPVMVSGVPEYIAQLMDKLIANAVEFTYPDTPITVMCRIIKDRAVLRVTNHGPYLPEEMQGRLFDSMISVRPQEKQREPHLGMGLHIARLVTEFHQGQIRAENIKEFEGVAITLVMPLLQE